MIQVSEIQPTVEPNKDLEKAQNEKQELERELDIQITENRRLGRVVFEQNHKIESLETSITQLNADSADKSSLLNQIQSDKETISRALQQNKTLKEQIEELQEAFVKMVTIFFCFLIEWTSNKKFFILIIEFIKQTFGNFLFIQESTAIDLEPPCLSLLMTIS